MERWICRNCEAENESTASVCVICGAKRTDIQPTPLMPEQNEEPQPRMPERIEKPLPRKERIEPRTTAPGQCNATASSDDAQRTAIKRYDRQKLLFRLLIVLFVIAQYVLFLQPYSMLVKRRMIGLYAIYYNVIGENGPIEQICSIILVVIAVLPAILCWINFKARHRSFPVTVCAFATILTTVYCAVIWFGSDKATVVPVCIILASCLVLLFTILLYRTAGKHENGISRPKGF